MDNERGGPRGGARNDDDTIENGSIQVERKTFFFALKENARGAFLRITEDVNGRRDSIILPASGLEDFRDELDRIIAALNDKDSSA